MSFKHWIDERRGIVKKIIIGMLVLASFSAMAEDLVPVKNCVGIDANGKSVLVNIAARMKNGSPIVSYAGQLHAVEVVIDNNLAYKVKVAHKTSDSYYTKFSDGSSQFSISISNNSELGAIGESARLYLRATNSFGVPVSPIYNTLKMTCSNP